MSASTVIVAINARLLRLKKATSDEVREADVSDEPRQSESRKNKPVTTTIRKGNPP